MSFKVKGVFKLEVSLGWFFLRLKVSFGSRCLKVGDLFKLEVSLG